MPASWPFEEFRAYLRRLMEAVGIVDYAELSRLTGVSQTQLSHWRWGKAQPSHKSLAALAPVLGVQAVELWVAAGLAQPEELDLTEAPSQRVLPQQFRDLLDLYDAGSEVRRERILLGLNYLLAGLRAEDSADQGQPSRRRRAG